MLTREFLQEVITGPPEGGYFCLALKGTSGWLEEWHRWPQDLDRIIERAEHNSQHSNVYFSSYLFKAPQSTRENVLATRTIQADLDEADITTLPRDPTILVETSPGRHQGYWVLDRTVTLEAHEELSKRLTYSIPLCDRSGWPLGRKVRIPNTLNHKYLSGPKTVTVAKHSGRTYAPEEFEALPEVPRFLVEHYDTGFMENPVVSGTHPLELLELIKDAIPVKVYVEYSSKQRDRSTALWALMCHAFKAGLNRSQVFTLAKGSANNKFLELKYRSDQELAKDVLRAEHAVNTDIRDERQLIQDLYKTHLSSIDRKRQIFILVLDALKKQGEFLHTHNGYSWYIRRDVGRPIAITNNSEMLDALLDGQFGLNATEPEARYVVHGLCAYVANLPVNATQSAMGYYDPVAKHMLLHTGRKSVLRISSAGVEHAIDGAHGIVFPWSHAIEEFTPAFSDIDWGEELFGNGRRGFGSSVNNLINMTPEQAMSLLKVWFMFVLFRQAASSRPIIATFGQPGSGKSTLFKKVYALLYGPHKAIGAVTSMEDFDHATATDPLVILDNVDTWERWLPDRIALSAGTSDVVKRKLWTDQDTVVLRRQAIVGVTAHNPRFGREDVADRFLLFSYVRLPQFASEKEILSDIASKRNLLWGAIVRDIQKILAVPPPTDNVPQFRIEDFARLGVWIARGLGEETHFVEAIADVKSSQQAFSLEEEGLLVSAVVQYAKRPDTNGAFKTTSQMWSVLEACSDDPNTFVRIYRNAVVLSKKLSAMQSSLKRVVDIEQGVNDAGTRTWCIQQKGGYDNG